MSAPDPNRDSSMIANALRIGGVAFVRHNFTLIAFGAILIAFAYLAAGRLGSSFKDVIQDKINERLEASGFQIAFSDIQFVDGVGIKIENLQVFLPQDLPTQAASQSPRYTPVLPNEMAPTALAHNSVRRYRLNKPFLPWLAPTPKPNIQIRQVWLKGHWTPASFVSGDFQPSAIELIEPELDLQFDANGKPLLPNITLPQSEKSPPQQIVIINGQLSLQCQRHPGKKWPLQIPRLQLNHDPSSPSPLTDWQANGQVSAFGLPDLQVHGSLNAKGFQVQAAGQPTNLHSRFWQELQVWLPPQLQELTGISGWVHLQKFSASGRLPDSNQPGRPLLDDLLLDATVEQIQLQTARLPQPVLNVSGRVVADLQQVRWENVSGRIGDGTFKTSGQIENQPGYPAQGSLVAHHLKFTKRWVPLLSEKMQADWHKFQPQGDVSCDLIIHKDAQGKVGKTGTLDVTDLSYVYADFPIPISGAKGRFVLKDQDCTYHLIVENQRYPLDIEGYANNMGPDWTGRINIRSTQYHPIDESLYLGLHKKPKVVEIIRAMNPTGQMAINGFIQKAQPQQKSDIKFNVGFHAGEIKHQKFPYRVFGIEGQLHFDNGDIHVEKMEGVSSTGNIKASGHFVQGQPWGVRIVGQAVELNTELYQALSETQQEIWQHLHPQGVLDQVVVDLYDEAGQFKVRVASSQQPSTASDPSYLSVNPDWFPYQLDGLSGSFLYENNQVQLKGIRGFHGAVSVAFDGSGQTQGDQWKVNIENLLTGQIPLGRDIKAALPETVRNATEQLQLEGSVSVQGAVTIQSQPHAQHPLVQTASPLHRLPVRSSPLIMRMQSDGRFVADSNGHHFATSAVGSSVQLGWNLRLDMEDGSLLVGLPAKHVHGMVQLQGESSAQDAYCHGTLNIDSAIVEGMQVTRIQGPIGMDAREITIGTEVRAPVSNGRPQLSELHSVTMHSMGGKISLDGQILLADDMPFRIVTTVDHLDLKKVATNFAPETRDIAGQGFASLNLNGSAAGTHMLSGHGRVTIKDARLYEVPLFLQLLKVVRVRKPDKTAFDEGKIQFHISGENIEMDRIELNGDAITLLGRGQANLDQEIDLNFYTVLGRNRLYVPVVSDLMHISSQQLLWISVDGTVANPDVTHETGRAINEALRLFVEDMEAASKLSP